MDVAKTENVMSVELAIRRELVYREKLACLGNRGLDLMPLKVPSSSCQVKPSNPTSKPMTAQNQFRSSQPPPGSISHRSQTPSSQIQNPIPRPDAFESEKLSRLRSGSGDPSLNPRPLKVPSSSYQVKHPNPTFEPMIAQNQFQSSQPSPGPTSHRPQNPISTEAQFQSPSPTPIRFQNPTPRPVRFQNPIRTQTQTSFPLPRPVPKQNQIQLPSSKPSYPIFPRPSFSSGPKRKGAMSNTEGHQFQKPKQSYPDCVIIHQEGYFYCNICQAPCSGPVTLHQHLKGRKHKTQLKLVNSGKKVQLGGERIEVQTSWRCELCDIWCMNEDALQQHFKGKNHIVKLHSVGNGN